MVLDKNLVGDIAMTKQTVGLASLSGALSGS